MPQEITQCYLPPGRDDIPASACNVIYSFIRLFICLSIFLSALGNKREPCTLHVAYIDSTARSPLHYSP